MSSYAVRRSIFLFWMSFDSVSSGAITELCMYKEIVPIWNFDGYSQLSSRYFEWRNDEQVLNKYIILLFNKNFLRVLKIFYYVDKVKSKSRLVVIQGNEWKQDKNIIRKGTYQNLPENMDIFQDPLPHKNSCFYSYKKTYLKYSL